MHWSHSLCPCRVQHSDQSMRCWHLLHRGCWLHPELCDISSVDHLTCCALHLTSHWFIWWYTQTMFHTSWRWSIMSVTPYDLPHRSESLSIIKYFKKSRIAKPPRSISNSEYLWQLILQNHILLNSCKIGFECRVLPQGGGSPSRTDVMHCSFNKHVTEFDDAICCTSSWV